MNARQYYASIKKDRDAWAKSKHQRCMLCGIFIKSLDIHEILRKSQAPKTWAFPANYLLLDRFCHNSPEIASTTRENLITQLAVKLIRDPENYDLQTWITTRHSKATSYISEKEVRSRASLLMEQKFQTRFRP
jgi:hypothetical protein